MRRLHCHPARGAPSAGAFMDVDTPSRRAATRSRVRHGRRLVMLILVAAVGGSCDEPTQPLRMGTLGVRALTTGVDPDTNGYLMTVQPLDGAPRPLPADGSYIHAELAPGEYSVSLSGAQENCIILNANPRRVAITATDTVATTFTVSCSALPGFLRVSAPTVGDSLDDAYTLLIGPFRSESVAANAAPLVIEVAAGTYELQLVDVAHNCELVPPFPTSATAGGRDTVEVVMPVRCTAPAVIVVRTPTSGSDLDPDTWVRIDRGVPRRLAIGDSIVQSVRPGSHEVELTGIDVNCTTNAVNPDTRRFDAGTTTRLLFPLECVPLPVLRVAVTTTGPVSVTNFYAFMDYYCDEYYYYGGCGYRYQLPVSPNGDASIKLPPGPHSVLLGNVPASCTVTSLNPRVIMSALAATNDIAFTVECR